MPRRLLTSSPLWTVVFLLTVSATAIAQTTVNLGKPTPNAQNVITVNVQTALGALPPPSTACTAPAPQGTGQYAVAFTASTDHNVIEHTVPKVSGYELVVNAPSTSQPCYTAVVRAVGPGGATASQPSAPFVLSPGIPSAPGSAPAISRSSGS